MSRALQRALISVCTVVLLALCVGLVYWPEATHVRKTSWVDPPGPAQPVAFYHHVHVRELHIPCAYCHWTASTSRTANIPPVDVCWGCHKDVSITHPEIAKVRQYYLTDTPIPWVRINQQPDYVHFSHYAHVAANVPCVSCHGDVGDMYVVYQPVEMNMGWCLQCHRKECTRFQPQKAADDCITCHY